MSLQLTTNAELASQKVNVEPVIVFKIEGEPTIFGAVNVANYIRVGDPDLYIGDDWVVGGTRPVDDQETILSLSGTGTSINQQLRPDQGSVSSVSSIEVALIDKDNIATRLISPGLELSDILGRKGKLYLGFSSTAFPQDYVLIFSGIIDDVSSDSGLVKFNLAHPDTKKRQIIFDKKVANLGSAITNTDISLPVVDADKVFYSLYTGPNGSIDTSLTHCVRIDDEVIKYTTLSPTAITGVTRGYLGTTAASHDADAEVSSFYVLEGAIIDLALKIMMSGKNGPFAEDVPIENINKVSPSLYVANSIFFKDLDVQAEYGIVGGDFVTVTGSTGGLNDFTNKPISQIIQVEDGSYVVVSGVTLVDEIDSPGVVDFRSQYDTLPIGLGMGGDEVDVEEHHYWRDLILSGLSYRFYLKEEIDGQEFLQKKVYAPCGAYSIPRKSKASMGFHIGPVPRDEIPTLNEDNVKYPDKIKLRRTINKNFYNTILYKWDQRVTTDEFDFGKVYFDQTSRNRIPVGTKTLTIDGSGIRTNLGADAFTRQTSDRYLSRYKFGAEFFENIEVFFKAGFNVEPGDLVILDPASLNISNTDDGNRDRPAKFYECTNKSIDLKTGAVKLSLTDTNYGIGERYGVVAPSSLCSGGSTTYAILTDSFGEIFPDDEPRKWKSYAGLRVYVHNYDYTLAEEIVFTGFDSVNRYKMLFQGALSFPVTAGMIIDVAEYPTNNNTGDQRLYKLYHAYLAPILTVTSGIDNFSFNVSLSDAAKAQSGFPIKVHDVSYAVTSDETVIDTVVGTVITVTDDLGFTPSAGQKVSFLGFADGDPCYRFV